MNRLLIFGIDVGLIQSERWASTTTLLSGPRGSGKSICFETHEWQHLKATVCSLFHLRRRYYREHNTFRAEAQHLSTIHELSPSTTIDPTNWMIICSIFIKFTLMGSQPQRRERQWRCGVEISKKYSGYLGPRYGVNYRRHRAPARKSIDFIEIRSFLVHPQVRYGGKHSVSVRQSPVGRDWYGKASSIFKTFDGWRCTVEGWEKGWNFSHRVRCAS